MTWTASRLIVEMMKAETGRLKAMDLEKVAQETGVKIDWVREYRRRELERRR